MKAIEISTTQNVIVKYGLASPLIRFLGFMIDLIIIVLTVWLAWLVFGDLFNIEFWDSYIWLPWCFYTLIFESLNKGATPGKMILGIRVMRIDGKELQFTDYLMRWIFRLVDIYFTWGALAVFGAMSSEKNQRLGDYLANTVVVVLRKQQRFKLSNLLKFDELKNYEVSFPQIVSFTEEEMLLIKEVVARYRAYPNEAHKLALSTTVNQIVKRLQIEKPENEATFLRKLIKDYVVLTR